MTDTEPAAPTDPTAPTDSTASPASATKEAIRAELEATRAQYRELLNSLSDEDWKQKSGNPSWNVRQLMWHMAWANGYTLNGVESCRKGKGTNPPNWISDFANTWRSEEHTSELQSRENLVCRLLLEKKKKTTSTTNTQ